MYGLQRRLNNDKAHVDLQKRTSDVRNTQQFLQQSSATTKLSDTQIRLCVLKVCQIIKYASAYFHTYRNLRPDFTSQLELRLTSSCFILS